jgi:NDP-sugar pyrophosphorylase family protein
LNCFEVLGFREKQSALGKQYVNAGIYLTNMKVISEIPADARVSLESELFPRWLSEGKFIRAFCHSGQCIDIGTPERFQSAQITLVNAEGGTRLCLYVSVRNARASSVGNPRDLGYTSRLDPVEP